MFEYNSQVQPWNFTKYKHKSFQAKILFQKDKNWGRYKKDIFKLLPVMLVYADFVQKSLEWSFRGERTLVAVQIKLEA